jgi:DNA-binding NarL/FixJ family response regulator
MIRILIADSLPLFRNGVRALLSEEKGLAVVGEATDSSELCTAIAAAQPTIALIGFLLPEVRGFELVRQVHESHPGVRIILISAQSNAMCVRKAMECGASGYLRTRCDAKELAKAIRVVAQGETYLSTALRSLPQHLADASEPADPDRSLTGREREVLELAGRGLDVEAIADALRIRASTVKVYKDNMRRKLGLRTMSGLLNYARARRINPCTESSLSTEMSRKRDALG